MQWTSSNVATKVWVVWPLTSTVLCHLEGVEEKQGLGECVNSIPYYECTQGVFIGTGRYWQRITCFRCKQHPQTRILVRTKLILWMDLFWILCDVTVIHGEEKGDSTVQVGTCIH